MDRKYFQKINCIAVNFNWTCANPQDVVSCTHEIPLYIALVCVHVCPCVCNTPKVVEL